MGVVVVARTTIWEFRRKVRVRTNEKLVKVLRKLGNFQDLDMTSIVETYDYLKETLNRSIPVKVPVFLS